MVSYPFLTSAPGKVILFGEHSAVYNKPAIAAALSLRTYLLVTKNKKEDNCIYLEFPDIGLHHAWKESDMPWHLTTSEQGRPPASEELNAELVNGLTPLLTSIQSPLHYAAAYCFLYLYLSLCHESVGGGITFTVRSTLPIGAGLGSSASISVCLASGLAYMGGHIKAANIERDSMVLRDSDECMFIDAWSFMGEKCIHGNPSGIDNAVATHGGAVMFQRMANSMPSVRTSMRNLPSINLLLTNTKTPRRTADLVSNVARIVNDFPMTSGCILEALEAIAREAYNLMVRPFLDIDSKKRLMELIRINHGLLVSLGVSHPNLEKIKLFCDELKMGETKLTGAGGGGCAITLLNDEMDKAEYEQKYRTLLDKFEGHGFETFQTTLGGKGVGLLTSPSDSLLEFMNVEKFVGFKDTTEIEKSVGCSAVDEWKYW
ncbi:Mevalonate kinase [Pichia kudriavzevii]|uniref:Mevalonate kinase n=2 Tax=Pichia kudriavzevii TaxID=4909 RepID=A0A1V2LPE8_PICKU|nr:Mevalonate kinase [Pichia kudriavzevii]